MILRPSSAARRIQCPGSYALEKKLNLPQYKTEQSIKGDMIHQAAADNLLGVDRALLSNEDENLILGYIQYIKDIIYHKGTSTLIDVWVEKKLKIPSIHELSEGTSDCILYFPDEVHVIDLKTGYVPVSAYLNDQLMQYAIGFYDSLNAFDIRPENIYLHIYQPNNCKEKYNIYHTRLEDLLTWASYYKKNEKIAVNLKENEIEEHLSPGDFCNYCPVRALCPELNKTIHIEKDILDLQSDNIGEKLQQVSNLKKLVEAQYSGLQEIALDILKSGGHIDGYMLGQGRGMQKWNTSPENLRLLEKNYGVAIFKEPEPITPKQSIKAGLPEEIVDIHSMTIPGAPKIVDQEELEWE